MEEIIHYIVDEYSLYEYVNKNIFIVENVFDKSFCEEMIKRMDESDKRKLNFGHMNNVQCFQISDLNNTDMLEIINTKITDILKIISNKKRFDVIGHTEIELRMVYGETRNHIDGVCSNVIKHPTTNVKLKSIRSVTIVGVFNDDYDGGVYRFPSQKAQIKLKAGSCIVFPPYWTHPHEVSNIIPKPGGRQHRYIVSAWGLDNFI